MATALAKIGQPTAYELARDRWEAARAAHRALHAKLEGARAALGQITQPEADDAPPKSPRLAALAQQYLNGRRSSATRLASEIADLQEQVEDASAAYASSRRQWDMERGLEQHRVSQSMRPELVAAARRIARLVEQLSEEVIRARELTAGLTELGVLTMDLGHEFGALSDYYSLLSQWNRRMLVSGLL